jgi:hypothetical protein
MASQFSFQPRNIPNTFQRTTDSFHIETAKSKWFFLFDHPDLSESENLASTFVSHWRNPGNPDLSESESDRSFRFERTSITDRLSLTVSDAQIESGSEMRQKMHI